MQTVSARSGVMSSALRAVECAVLSAQCADRRQFDVAAYSKPARAYTGDFYLTHRAADRLWFALGDVSGKGAHAAVVMAMIQEELEHRITSCAATRCNPARTMQRLHDFLQPLLPGNRFATVTIGHLRDDGVLTIANAGHCPPLIATASGVESIASTGPVAGLLPSSSWHSVTRQLQSGDALLLFSDGLVEARDACGDELGEKFVRETFARVANGDASEIVSRMVNTARREVTSFEDDLTLLAIRF